MGDESQKNKASAQPMRPGLSLPQKIKQIRILYTTMTKKTLDNFPPISDDAWNELEKTTELEKITSLLEKILLDTIRAWQKPERFLFRRKPEECLITKINHQSDYQSLQLIALTLKNIYETYPNKFFLQKEKLNSFVKNIMPSTESDIRQRYR